MKLSLVGSGNVANHLAKAFIDAGHELISIYSRNNNTGKHLAEKTGANFCAHPKEIDKRTQVLILAVPDDEISRVATIVAPELDIQKSILCHTSGTTGLETISMHYQFSGTFYPLQTFSINKSVDLSEVPFCINGTNEKVTKTLENLAKSISKQVVLMDDDQRKVLHIAAVFANNFSNYMYVISEKLCSEANLDFALLRPLIKMTTEKILEFSPKDMQTGPAKRKDVKVIKEHLKFLEDYPEYREIYSKISSAIENQS